MSDFTVGDVATLDYTLTVDGVATDATVAVTVTAPDGTETTPTVDNPAVGSYTADVPLTEAGLWTYAWTATGDATDAETGSFTVRVAGGVSLAQVKQHLQITNSTHDVELARFLAAAETRLSHEVGPLTATEIVEQHAGPGPLLLRVRPVQSVTSIDDYGTALTADLYEVETGAGTVHGADGRWFSTYTRGVTVTYTAGHSNPLPADLQQAVLELVRHLWLTQRGAASGSGARADLLGGSDGPSTAAGMAAYTLPHRVLELIRPYQQRQLIA